MASCADIKLELRETWLTRFCYWAVEKFQIGTIEFWMCIIPHTTQAKFGSRPWRYFHFAFKKYPKGIVSSFFDAVVCIEESHGCQP